MLSALRGPGLRVAPALPVPAARARAGCSYYSPTPSSSGTLRASRITAVPFSANARTAADAAAAADDSIPGPMASAAAKAAAAARPGIAYSLGRTLYLALTNRANSAGIVSTRGPG